MNSFQTLDGHNTTIKSLPPSQNSVIESLSHFWQNRRISINDNSSGSKLSAIVLSQLIALLAASTNAASSSLVSNFGLTTQFLQMIPMYTLLSLQIWSRSDEANSSGVLLRKNEFLSLRVPWWIYFIISVFFDVFPNFLVLRSLCFTSLPTVTLLGALSVPSSMFFSKILLHRTFQLYHYLGVCLCILGGCLTVWCDQDHKKIVNEPSASTTELSIDDDSNLLRIWGDLFVISSALVFGLGDVVAEQAVKQIDRNEYLGMIGIFGFIQSILGTAIFESQAIAILIQMPSTRQMEAFLILLWYTTSVYMYYRTCAYFLTTADATLLNLSGQASNVWAILFSVTMYHFMPSALFFIALLLVVWGVFMYEGYYPCFFKRWLDAIDTKSDQETNLLLTKNSSLDTDYNSIAVTLNMPDRKLSCHDLLTM